MKKNSFLFFLVFGLFVNFLGASSLQKVYETRIENGMSVFLLQDFSNPQIHLEINVRAGVSSQTAETAGFVNLYSTLVQKSSKLDFESVQCNADSTRFILNISPSELESVLYTLSDNIFNLTVSDALLKSELAVMKREVMKNASESGSLINSSIDSRVFSEEPWRNDSGIYPALFSKATINDARLILSKVSDSLFVPGNSAIFMSGNFSSEETLKLIEKYFGRFFSLNKPTFKPLVISNNKQKKYIIHSKDFSEELTQIVVQYSSFASEESKMAAELLNNNPKLLKNKLCESNLLNIPGNEYIDFSAATKSGSARLIVQSLLQTEKNVLASEQVSKFLEILKNPEQIDFSDFSNAVVSRKYQFDNSISTSSSLMNSLAEYWAQESYYPVQHDLNLTERFTQNFEEQIKVPSEIIWQTIKNESPFVFVILNTKTYNKCKNKFTNQGFEEITSKNASWYTDNLYKNVKSLMEFSRLTEDSKAKSVKQNFDYSKNFYEENIKAIKTEYLSNGIPVTLKKNENSTGVTFLVYISGGNLRTADDHGFEEVMTNVLAMNILRQLKRKQAEGLLLNDFEITSETQMEYSKIILECLPEDLYVIENAVVNSLIMDEIIPSDADRIVSGRRTRKRLENGSTINQLYSEAIRTIYPGSDFEKIFETEKEILSKTSYEKILQNYPALLDSTRYKFYIAGNIQEEKVLEHTENAFGLLQSFSKAKNEKEVPKLKEFPFGQSVKVKLNHTFLTDIPAKDAGPMPAVLIPTKSFADPVLFCVKENGDRTIFNALLIYLQKEIAEASKEKNNLFNCKISASTATDYLDFGTISFSSVEKTSACENVYKSVYSSLKNQLENTKTVKTVLQKIKNEYIAFEFGNVYTNTGCASSMAEGKENPAQYLENYKRINDLSAAEILNVLESDFNYDKIFKVYSADSKK